MEKRELGRGEGWRGSWGGGRGGEGVMERWGGGGREGSDEAQEYS